MNQPTVLIISDEAEFSRTLVSRWQVERTVPVFTVMSSDVWTGAGAPTSDAAIVGPVNEEHRSTILRELDAAGISILYLSGDAGQLQSVRDVSPRILALRQSEAWPEIAVLLCNEILRRTEAASRAKRAEDAAERTGREATLGRYMLEMRHNLNNALTSVLGNAELLLLEPGTFSAEVRDQLDTIHSMALRMHEIIQRFSSLEMEMRFAEKMSHHETNDSLKLLFQPDTV